MLSPGMVGRPLMYLLTLHPSASTELFWWYVKTQMLLRATKTRNITFCGEETSQILLTAFSLLAANKSTIIKMLSKWLEIFLTLSKSHISWVDYPGQRICHLPECLSSRKLKDSYKHCLINPYIRTCRENRRKCHHSRLLRLNTPNKEAAGDTWSCRVGPAQAQSQATCFLGPAFTEKSPCCGTSSL